MQKQATFNSRWLPWLLIAPQMIVVLVFFYWPAGQAVLQSFLLQDAFGLSTTFVWFENYKELFADPDYFATIVRTFVFAFAIALSSLSLSLLLTVMADKRSAPRVAFGLLVESGLVPAGATLTDSKRRWFANVRADGSIASGPHSGSIHKVGAALQGAPSCNGWTFWHLDDSSGLTELDVLRQRHLAAL